MTPTNRINPLGINACRQWYTTPAGQVALASLQQAVSSRIVDVFGYYALEIGSLAGQYAFLQESRIASQFTLSSVLGEPSQLIGLPEQLPIAFSNIDLIVATHVLDCSAQPHQVLREIERVLVPEGHCILIGFNPFSWHGINTAVKRSTKLASGHSMYSSLRVREWLQVLGFEVMETVSSRYSLRLSTHNRSWLGRLGDLYHIATGDVYLIHAQKKVSNRIPIMPSLKVPPILAPGMIVNPETGRIYSPRGQDEHS